MPIYGSNPHEDPQEEFGWKLVHGDVFRPPRKGMMLSVLIGSGAQVFFMISVTIGRCHVMPIYGAMSIACLGFLYPGNRGFLLSAGVVMYVCLGSPAGYTAARIYKSKCLSVCIVRLCYLSALPVCLSVYLSQSVTVCHSLSVCLVCLSVCLSV
eukprot:sb/3473302/